MEVNTEISIHTTMCLAWILITGSVTIAYTTQRHDTVTLFCSVFFRRDFIFWSDPNHDRISRSYLNGTGQMVIVSGEMSCVRKYSACVGQYNNQ